MGSTISDKQGSTQLQRSVVPPTSYVDSDEMVAFVAEAYGSSALGTEASVRA